ncbi:YhaN family protein [Stappia sp. ES.058]|uniref:YhaN family protein n=1 Tax=Stappia sp. ES.058 TaxID=1881061 RepID=UPI00087B292B|nr:YhaN family protein [Stappia sp. ES.058]SDT93569.1 AAA domain-containing protein [Stappia sp. ES.058]
MRFERLHFLRYGNLTDVTFRFRPDARLHLVYGPNEAGKSSALAAVSDLLFGFSGKRKTADGEYVNRYDFLHSGPSLRVAATLRNRAGETIDFRRRRGRKNTLLSDSDGETPLRDDALTPFLGGLSRDVFERSFGLNSETLRKGAEAMLAGEGGEDGLLLAAASGLGGLREARAALSAEADAIFTPRAARERLFYQARARYDEAWAEEKEHRLREKDWKALNTAIADSQAAVDEVRAALTAIRKRQGRLQQLEQFDELLAETRAHERALFAFADLEAVPTGIGRALHEELASANRAEAAHRAAMQELDTVERERDRISPDAALLAKAETVTRLFSQTGAYRERHKDIPRVQADVDEQTHELAALLRRLGLGALPTDSEALAARQPSDAVLATIEEGVEHGRLLLSRRDQLAQDIAELRQELSKLPDGADGADIGDPAPIAARFAALGPDIKALETLGDLRERHRGERRRAVEAASRLSPPVGDIHALAGVALPSVETLSEHRTRLSELQEMVRRHDAGMRERMDEIMRLDAEIVETERAGDMPTPMAIADARERRDAALSRLLEDLAAGAGGGNAAALEAHASLVREADRLADRAASEAERVSRHADMSRNRAGLQAEQDAATSEQERLALVLADAQRAFRTLFEPAHVEPRAPGEMIAWRQNVDAALSLAEEAEKVADRISSLEAREDAVAGSLSQIAAELGVEAGYALPLSARVRLVEEALGARSKAWSEGRTRLALRQDAKRRLSNLDRKAEENADALSRWRAELDAELQAIGLPAGTGLEAVAGAVALWRDLPEKLKLRDLEAKRVHGMKRENAAFDAALDGLVSEVAPDLADHVPDAAADALHRRLETAQSDQTRREGAQTRVRTARERLEQSAEGLESARAHLSDSLARLPETLRSGDLADLATRLEARDGEAAALASAHDRFERLAKGESRANVEAELADFDAEAATVDLDLLKREEADRDKALNDAYHRLQTKTAERALLERGDGVERAAFRKLAAENEMMTLGREWMVLKLAEGLLSTAMEHHRAQTSDPVMARAGTIFKRLTQGSFATLTQVFDDDDHARLMACREDGAQVPVDALSEGSRDQLYLALRLAFLADYSARAEAAPFIGDDLFQTFDDTRTAAGISALADLSQTVQPILFTHHLSVVDIARKTLGEGLDLLEF